MSMAGETINADIRAALEWGFEHVLDADSSGFIEMKEGLMVAKYLGLSGENADVAAVWKGMLADMDTDGDGKISKEEYVVYMAGKYCGRLELAQQLKAELQHKQNAHATLQTAAAATVEDVEEIALDGSAEAAAEPAVDVVAAEASPAVKQPVLTDAKRAELEKKFQLLDADRNGTLSKEEVAEAMLMEECDKALEELWKAADVDGDGQVTLEEFVAAADAFDKADGEVELPGLP